MWQHVADPVTHCHVPFGLCQTCIGLKDPNPNSTHFHISCTYPASSKNTVIRHRRANFHEAHTIEWKFACNRRATHVQHHCLFWRCRCRWALASTIVALSNCFFLEVQMQVGLSIHHCGVVTVVVCRVNSFTCRWAFASTIVALSRFLFAQCIFQRSVGLSIQHCGVVNFFKVQM